MFAWGLGELQRAAGAGNRNAKSAELDVTRTELYLWRGLVRRDGEKAFPGKPGRRSKAELMVREHGVYR